MIEFNDVGLETDKSYIIKRIIEQLSIPKDGSNYRLSYHKNKFLIECIDEKFKTSFSIDELMRDEDKIFTKLFPYNGGSILDCTAGLGRDGILLSRLGFNVTMIEKNPLLVLIIKNYLSKNKHIKSKLLYGDSLSFVRLANKQFDYIYIDFMFEKKNNSKPSKYDLFLRSINYNESNKLYFIDEMISYCKKRLIVKEPIKSQSDINNHDFEIKTKLIKYKIFNGKSAK